MLLRLKTMIKYVFFDLDETLIDIKKAQNIAIETLFGLYAFNNVTDINSFIKKWDELTDYHYKFYTTKQISYEEQRKRRITDLFKTYNIPLTIDAIDVYNIYLKEFLLMHTNTVIRHYEHMNVIRSMPERAVIIKIIFFALSYSLHILSLSRLYNF